MDLFKGDEIVEKYSRCRDVYPPALTSVIMQFLRKHNPSESKPSLMVDVACGGGQCTAMFAKYFDSVLAFDISQRQIETAINRTDKPSNVVYRVASADALPCKDASVDLVVCAEAVHLLDWGAFLGETERIVKPEGCLALVGYWMPKVIPVHVQGVERQRLADAGTQLLRDFKLEGGYREWVKDAFASGYRKFYDLLPWPAKEHDLSLKGELTWSLTQLMCYVDSLYNYRKRLERLRKEARLRNPDVTEGELAELDYGRRMRRGLKEVWGVAGESDENVFMIVEFPIFLVLGGKSVV